jgi:hypothetical protein
MLQQWLLLSLRPCSMRPGQLPDGWCRGIVSQRPSWNRAFGEVTRSFEHSLKQGALETPQFHCR